MTTRNYSSCRKLAPVVREISTVKDYMALLLGVKVCIRSVQCGGLRVANRKLADAKVQPLVVQVGWPHTFISLLGYRDVDGNLMKKLKDQFPSAKAIARLLENI